MCTSNWGKSLVGTVTVVHNPQVDSLVDVLFSLGLGKQEEGVVANSWRKSLDLNVVVLVYVVELKVSVRWIFISEWVQVGSLQCITYNWTVRVVRLKEPCQKVLSVSS